MNVEASFAPREADPRLKGIIKLAILAVGGQGGGVLTSWIETVARNQGYAAQATSVAGVAQRTGATIYYIEMAPAEEGRMPVFSLAPSPGDVDVLIAAELMEAGRAIQRGFVTPDRTTLIASTHRALAVSEKMVPGDGIAKADEVTGAAEIAASRVILGDMDRAATDVGSVISASLLGALAGSGALPFPREAYEEAIRASGKGVEASLRAFAAGIDLAEGKTETPRVETQSGEPRVFGPAGLMRDWDALTARVAALPEPARDIARAGLEKVVNFQDTEYGALYLDRVEAMAAKDDAAQKFELTREAAKYIANAMAYDDIIRVADLKTRGSRFDRIRTQMGADDDKVLHLTEYFHPRAEEIVGMMPAGLGGRLHADPKWMARIDRVFNRGRRLRTDTLRAFLMLYVIGGLKRWRLRTHRHAMEEAHIARWLEMATAYLPGRYGMAVEVLRCRRLIKGYSDTHARGLTKFDRVLQAARRVEDREDGPDWVARLREAALKDEEGKALDGAIRTIESFAGAPAGSPAR